MLIVTLIKKQLVLNIRNTQVKSDEIESSSINTQESKTVNVEQKDGKTIETSIRIYCLEVERWKTEQALVKKISKELETGRIVYESSDFGIDKLTYKSSNENVAKVDENGNVTGISEGEARITVSNGTLTDWCTAFVTKGTIPDIEFNINISNLTTTGWTQSAVATVGNLDGFSVEYSISKEGITEAESTTSNVNVYQKESSATYYVWANAIIDGIKIKSNNYAKITTGHTHKGKPSLVGGCYGGEKYATCSVSKGYVAYWQGNLKYITKDTTSYQYRYCSECGKRCNIADGFYKQDPSTGMTYYKMCLECGGTSKTLGNTGLCPSCHQKIEKIELPLGSIVDRN